MSGLSNRPNGDAAAAILACGLGSFALGALALAADASPAVNHALSLYKPTGALSGVTTGAIGLWLASWAGLSRICNGRNLSPRLYIVAGFLLFLGVLLTFPPFMDLLQGK